ncbi:anthranilate phosphoribosyltransferase [Candidatus Daviesbacteria bacterium]|nr:anthranilate phosphoribosyltransferase [Candidatus Daviesbacteria bacterium]
MEIKNSISKLLNREDLSEKEAIFFIDSLALGKINSSQIAAVLTLLKIKGESTGEVLGLIKGMRKYMVSINHRDLCIDTCGTGGDGANTFNISTITALVVAGVGVKVAKHGNRAASGKCGSADILEELGANISLDSKKAEEILNDLNFTFLFAPLYHPVMKILSPIRKDLSFPTVFNYIGPFLNPAKVKRQIIGVASISTAKKLAEAAKHLGYEYLLIISSKDGLDEISLGEKTEGYEIKGTKMKKIIIDPSRLGFKKSPLKNIQTKSIEENKKILTDILNGKHGDCRDVVLVNSAYALLVSGKSQTLKEALQLASESIDSGKALKVLNKFIQGSNQ